MRAPWLATLAGAMLTLALSIGTPAAAAPEPVKVRAGAHDGFGRLVFEWSAPVGVASERQGQRLTLRFARPFAADLSTVLDAIGDDLVGLEHDGGAREVVLRLAPEVTPTLDIDEGRIVIVDLHRASVASAPAGGPAAMAVADRETSVAVRTGVHDSFFRIVLDWSKPTEFVTTAEDRRLRIRFERAAWIYAARIAERGQSLIEAASASQGDGWSELRLSLRAGVRPELFKEGRLVVIDLHEEPRPTPDPRTLELLPSQAPRPSSVVPSASLARTASRAPGDQLAAPAAAPEPGLPRLALEIAAAEVSDGLVLEFVWSRPTAAAFLVRAGYLWSIFAPPAAAGGVVLPSLASPAPGWLGAGEPVDAAGGIALRFPLRRPVAARVDRAQSRWRVALGANAAPPAAVRLERLADPPRLRIPAGEVARLVSLTDPEVGDRLEIWPLLTPGLGQPRAQRLVDLELLATAQGVAWRPIADQLRTQVVAGAVELSMPEGLHLSQDSLTTVRAPDDAAESAVMPGSEPLAEPGKLQVTVAPAPSSTELSATEQAKAQIRPPDHAASAPGPPPVVVATDRAPALAEAEPASDAAVRAAPSSGSSSPLGLTRFAPAGPGSLLGQRAYWQERVVNAPAEQRPAARLDLARFLLAHALGAEALAVLAMIEPDATPAEPADDLARRTLTGAAELLMDRTDEAATGLEVPALSGDPEAALWRAVLAGARTDWTQAAKELARSGTMLDGYPLPLQLRLGLPAARMALEAGDHDGAARVLRLLQALDLSPIERDRIALLEGMTQAGRGAIDDADRTWQRLERSPDRQTRIAAGFARVQMLLEAGRLSAAEALARLMAARPLWRPHPQEPAMLDALARLYLRNDQPAAALHAWQEALSRFPGASEAARIEQAMRDSFLAALLPAQGAGLGAVRSYALYRDFPELVPDDAAGDRLRRRLADQLAGLDLVEQAASLLEPLLDHLQAAASAETGAELAELQLRVPDPAAALAALDRTETGAELPQALRLRRRSLRARALAASDQPRAALALLEGAADPALRRLSADIFWDQRDWRRLSAALEDLLPARAGADAPLAEADRELVLRLSLAYAHERQPGALEGLRRRFGEAMRGDEREPAFLMATLPAGRAAGLEPALAAADEHLARVRAWLGSTPDDH